MKKVLLVFIAVIISLSYGCNNDNNSSSPPLPDGLPDVNQAKFSNPTNITNELYGPPVGKTYIYNTFLYENGIRDSEPDEIIKIERKIRTEVVSNITCIIHSDRVTTAENNILVENTDDWLAQDDDGNVWYMGEDVANYDDNGNFLNHKGAWRYGEDGALPGYWLPANPVVGKRYYQEYRKGKAEDMIEFKEKDLTKIVGLGTEFEKTYTNCYKFLAINPFEPKIIEYKYYVPGVGFIIEEKFEEEKLVEVVELLEIQDHQSK